MVLEEIPSDLLTIVLPVVIGVGMVLGTVMFIFWLGSSSKKTYEEVKALAARKAEEKLKEKEHSSPKPKKKSKNFRKKKVEEVQEEPKSSRPSRKGILKSVETATAVGHTPDHLQVDFKLDITSLKKREKEEEKKLLNSPPTPYPKELRSKVTHLPGKEHKLSQLLFDGVEEVSAQSLPSAWKESARKESARKEEPMKNVPIAATKPAVATSVFSSASNPPPANITPTRSEKPSGVQKKVKAKSKQQIVAGSPNAQSVSHISEILSASPLSDEEIQRLIELLLEKSNDNSEWEATSLKADSRKSLRKHNLELQSLLDDAQQSLLGHSSKIKELRREIQMERNKYLAAENGFQAKLAHQNKELSINKNQSSVLEDDLRQLRAQCDTQYIQKLREDNGRLNVQNTHYQQQIAEITKELKNEQDMVRGFKAAAGGAIMSDKMAEAERLLEQNKRELEGAMQHSNNEIMRLKSELTNALEEGDMYKKATESLEVSLNHLKMDLHHMSSEKDASSKEVAQITSELQTQHLVELENLRKTISDGMAETAEAEGVREAMLRMEVDKKALTGEVEELKESMLKLEEENEAMKGQEDELEVVREVMMKVEVDKKALTGQVEELKESIMKLEEENEAMKGREDELEVVQEVMIKVEVDKKALTSQVEELKESIMKLEEENEAMKGLEDELEVVQEVMMKVEVDKKALAGQAGEESMMKLVEENGAMKKQEAEVERFREAMLRLEEVKETLDALVEESAGEQQSRNERVATLSEQLEDEVATMMELEEKMTARPELDGLSSLQVSEGDKLVNNGEEMDHSLLLEQQEQLTKDLKEGVAVLGKMLGDLKCTNSELGNSLLEAKDAAVEAEKKWEMKIKQAQSEFELKAKSSRTDALIEAHQVHSAILQKLFPEVSIVCVGEDEDEKWLEEFEEKAQKLMETRRKEIDSLKEHVAGLERLKEQSMEEVKHFRHTLETTMDILKKLQSEVDTTSEEHHKAMEAKEKELEMESVANKVLQDELESSKAKLVQVMGQLADEQESVAMLREEVEATKEAGREGEVECAEGAANRLQELEQRLQEVVEIQKKSVEEVGNLRMEVSEKEEARLESQQRMADECKLKEDASERADKFKSQLEQVQEELKICSENLEVMKQSNLELNARLSAPVSPTDCEV